MSENRTYRNLVQRENLVAFNVRVKETDIHVHTSTPLEEITRELVLEYRGYIESYINRYPEFVETLTPWLTNGPTPAIITDMVKAGTVAGVGPMAAVAGAVAEHVGTALLSYSEEVIVENGGDVFLKLDDPITVGIYAGDSPLSYRLGLHIDPGDNPVSVCTSSGTIGHSLSLGKADAASVISRSGAIADAAATAIANIIQSKSDIPRAIEFGKKIDGISGIAVIKGDKIGLWGDIEVVPLKAVDVKQGKKC